MAGRSSEIVDLRGFLAPGIHDVMIEILGPKGQSRRIASAMILRISEACLPVYPLSTSVRVVAKIAPLCTGINYPRTELTQAPAFNNSSTVRNYSPTY